MESRSYISSTVHGILPQNRWLIVDWLMPQRAAKSCCRIPSWRRRPFRYWYIGISLQQIIVGLRYYYFIRLPEERPNNDQNAQKAKIRKPAVPCVSKDSGFSVCGGDYWTRTSDLLRVKIRRDVKALLLGAFRHFWPRFLRVQITALSTVSTR